MRYCEKMWYRQTGHRHNKIRRTRLHAVHLRLHTHSEYVIFIVFHRNIGYTKAPQCYVICILAVLLTVCLRPADIVTTTRWLRHIQ